MEKQSKFVNKQGFSNEGFAAVNFKSKLGVLAETDRASDSDNSLLVEKEY